MQKKLFSSKITSKSNTKTRRRFMKYIYIICLAMSSFFTYKNLSANSYSFLNAFFIPNQAFQQNTSTSKIEQMKPRYSQKSSQNISEDSTNTIEEKQIQNISSPSHQAKKNTVTKEITQKPLAKSSTPKSTTQKKPIEVTVSKVEEPKKVSPEKKKITTKYSLDDTPTSSKPQQNNTEEQNMLSTTEQFDKKSIKEMLNTLPSPNFKLPKYQQLYALYGLELRSMYRRGYLPANYEQEETLNKVNSIRRFKVN